MKAALDTRRGLPPKFAEIEAITEPWMSFYIESFSELSTDRPANFGSISPIPRRAIDEFAREYDVPLADFRYIIREMDGLFMKLKDSKNGGPQPIRASNGTTGQER